MQTYNFGNINGTDAVDGARGATGATGARGAGFVFRGDWAAGVSYVNGDSIDVVKYKGDYYYCKISTRRSDPPYYDPSTWGLFARGESQTVLHCTIAYLDWETYYDEVLQETVEKAVAEFSGVEIPSNVKYFLRIDPELQNECGIRVAAVESDRVTFYANNTPSSMSVSFDFCYKTISESVIAAEKKNTPFTDIYVRFTEDTGKDISISSDYYPQNFPVVWGDGKADKYNYHTYEEYGTYTMKIKGNIGGAGSPFFPPFNYTVTGVRFYDNVIDEAAFNGCRALTDVTFSGKETTIPLDAFANTGIQAISIPEGVTRIDHSAFASCHNLRTVTLGEKLRTISTLAFSGCESLTSINLDDVHEIGIGAFEDCTSLTTVKLIDIHTLGSSAFQGCTSIHTVVIESGMIRELTSNAFLNCKNLTDVYMGRSITYIGLRCFFDTDMEDAPIDRIKIHYSGTKAEFQDIGKGRNWARFPTIYCVDGVLHL